VRAALLVVGLAVVSIRGLIDPQQASLRFGFPVSDAAEALFYRVYLSRNLVIVACKRGLPDQAPMDAAGRLADGGPRRCRYLT
jgi:hypothetical protein